MENGHLQRWAKRRRREVRARRWVLRCSCTSGLTGGMRGGAYQRSRRRPLTNLSAMPNFLSSSRVSPRAEAGKSAIRELQGPVSSKSSKDPASPHLHDDTPAARLDRSPSTFLSRIPYTLHPQSRKSSCTSTPISKTPKINHAARQSQHAQTRNSQRPTRAGRDRGRGSHSDPRPPIGRSQKLNPGRVGRAPAGQSRRETGVPARAGDVRLSLRAGMGAVPSPREVSVGPWGRRLVEMGGGW